MLPTTPHVSFPCVHCPRGCFTASFHPCQRSWTSMCTLWVRGSATPSVSNWTSEGIEHKLHGRKTLPQNVGEPLAEAINKWALCAMSIFNSIRITKSGCSEAIYLFLKLRYNWATLYIKIVNKQKQQGKLNTYSYVLFASVSFAVVRPQFRGRFSFANPRNARSGMHGLPGCWGPNGEGRRPCKMNHRSWTAAASAA